MNVTNIKRRPIEERLLGYRGYPNSSDAYQELKIYSNIEDLTVELYKGEYWIVERR